MFFTTCNAKRGPRRTSETVQRTGSGYGACIRIRSLLTFLGKYQERVAGMRCTSEKIGVSLDVERARFDF